MRGFTLIELLVVLAISGLLMSLVGPVAIEQYERSQFLKEREQLLRIIEHGRSQALLYRTTVQLSLQSNSVNWQQGNEKKTWLFTRLHFPAQRLSINANGFYSGLTTLKWQEHERRWQLALNPEQVQDQIATSFPAPEREYVHD